MPEISKFYGIRITMNYNDHLPPHFHAAYGGSEAQLVIATGAILHGSLPPTAAKMVREWSSLHRAELEENWTLRGARLPLHRIEGLE